FVVPTVEVGALDRTVVERGHAHVGPIDVTGLDIHGDAVGQATIGDDGLAVGAIGIHRVNAASAQLENEQSARAGDAQRVLRFGGFEDGHGLSFGARLLCFTLASLTSI